MSNPDSRQAGSLLMGTDKIFGTEKTSQKKEQNPALGNGITEEH